MSQENTQPLPGPSGDMENLKSKLPGSQEPSSCERRKPDWDLCVRRKGESGPFQKIGAGWSTERGGIAIQKDRDVSIDFNEIFGGTWSVYLFPHRPSAQREGRRREFGSWPKRDPRNVRPGESMQQFFDRRRG